MHSSFYIILQDKIYHEQRPNLFTLWINSIPKQTFCNKVKVYKNVRAMVAGIFTSASQDNCWKKQFLKFCQVQAVATSTFAFQNVNFCRQSFLNIYASLRIKASVATYWKVISVLQHVFKVCKYILPYYFLHSRILVLCWFGLFS